METRQLRRGCLPPWIKVRWRLIGMAVMLLAGIGSHQAVAAPLSSPLPSSSNGLAEYVILFVLEGVGQEALKIGPMPTLSRLVKEGSVTWRATAVTPALRLPTMASLLTGLPVEKHKITWNDYEFIRGYLRAPTVFDYLDLSGGKDSAIFLMDESLYQLARPEPYTDYQMCGPLKPECDPARVVRYIRDYFRKATSGDGYGHAILSLPHFLVVHLPEPARAGTAHDKNPRAYGEALRAVDSAMRSVLDLYKELRLLDKTAVIVTALSGTSARAAGSAAASTNGMEPPRVPWIAWGYGIKPRYAIKQPMSIMDTGATVLRMLGLETHTEWQSHAVEEIFKTSRPTAGGEAHAQ